MKITRRQLRHLIEQAVEHDLANDHPSDIEPREDATAGGDNLVLQIDYAESWLEPEAGDATPHAPEMLSLIDDAGIVVAPVPTNEARIRSIIRRVLTQKR